MSRASGWRQVAALAVLALSASTINQAVVHASPGANGRIAFVRATTSGSELWTMTPTGDDARKVPVSSAQVGSPAWSPEGSRIAYYGATTACTAIFVVNADGSGEDQLTSGTECDSQPSWSPDGMKIAFTRSVHVSVGSSYDIIVMNADGTHQRNITQSYPQNEYQVSWSPRGDRLAFTAGSVIETSTPKGTRVKAIAQGDEPTWSPDGRRISFVQANGEVNGGTVYDIFTMRPSGADVVPVTDLSARSFFPRHSPDGTQIAFYSTLDAPDPTNCDGSACNYEVYVVSGGGGVPVRLTDRAMLDGYPDWQPVCTISGSGTIMGTGGQDVICGSPGPDTIYGLGKADVVLGGGGDDTIHGGGGGDRLWGGLGADHIVGNGGADILGGGPSADDLDAQDGVSGNDRIDGGEGTDACAIDADDHVIGCP